MVHVIEVNLRFLDLFKILPGIKHSVTLRYFSCLYVILGFIKTNVLYIILLFFQFQFFLY